MNNKNRYMPLMLALCVVLGIVIGTFYANHFSGNRLNIINSGSNRLNNLLHIIDDQYIDSLVEKAIPQILVELDPHSVYLTAKEVEINSDDLKGSFSGVGIEFVIREDTIRVQNVVKNGPSERAGLLAGDKIVTIDDSSFVGKKVTSQEAMRRLKGPKDTKVKIGVQRFGHKDVLQFTVTRGDIPQRSIASTYMLDNHTGYIRIKNFGETTYAELLVSLATLAQQSVDNLIIDLRDNTGGYLDRAVQIANEFLPKNKLIVYTQGRKSPRQEYRSDGHGSYQNIPLVVLINEGSASASEIFAGRCIQKPYSSESEYEKDLLSRYEHGEFFSSDSIKHTGPVYHTGIGREVYGGGGITPDIFVPEDTTNMTSYYKQAAMSGLIMQFAFSYTDNNRLKLNNFKEMMELSDYLVRQNTVEKFAQYADNHGLKRRNLLIQKSHKLLERYINSRIIYNMLDENAWTRYINQDDPVIFEALRIFKENASFPKLPEADEEKEKPKKVAWKQHGFDYNPLHSRTTMIART